MSMDGGNCKICKRWHFEADDGFCPDHAEWMDGAFSAFKYALEISGTMPEKQKDFDDIWNVALQQIKPISAP